jgi:16S rRNA (uracil1498-N3)-methyltransferase
MDQFIASSPQADLKLIAAIDPDARRLKSILADAAASSPTPIRHALVLIGPEGDFTPAEYGLARSQGFLPLSLGPIILRTETAAIYTISILAHELM